MELSYSLCHPTLNWPVFPRDSLLTIICSIMYYNHFKKSHWMMQKKVFWENKSDLLLKIQLCLISLL